MTLTIELSPESEAGLKAQARVRGLTVEQWLVQLATLHAAKQLDYAWNSAEHAALRRIIHIP